jgi:hypothetical protein
MSVESLVNYFKSKPLSGDSIKEAINKYPILYSELKNYNSIDDVLGNEGYAILMYEVSRYSGHYVSIFKDSKGNINFQDPYGFPVDVPINNNMVPFDKPLPRYLTLLLSKSKYNVIQNTFDYQSKQSTVQDCGRHSICRIKLRHLSNEQYKRLLINSSIPFLNCDNIVTLMTLLVLNKNVNQFYDK